MPTDLDDDFDLDDLDSETPDDSELVRRLRKELRRHRKEAKAKAEIEEENRTLKREKAFRDAKIDGLSERQMRALEREHEGDMTPDALRQTAIDLGFLRDETADDLAEHEQIDNAASGSRAPKTGTITPADVASWGTDKILDFKATYPAEFERLKRGEEVAGITF